MASITQICNMALSHIGADARVSSISPPDGSVEAGHCAMFYDAARTEMLESGNWAFSLRRGQLTEVTNTSNAWGYAYAKPSDCMRPLRILVSGAVSDGTGAQFVQEGDTIYCDEPEAVLVYVRDVTDSGKFTPSFVSALSFLLGAYIAGPVIKGQEGMRIGDAMRQRALSVAAQSAATSANASQDAPVERTLQEVRA